MKRFLIIFFVAAMLVGIVCVTPAVWAASDSGIISAYYGVNTTDRLIGQIAPGTSPETLYSRVIADGTLSLSKGVATGSNLILTTNDTQIASLTLVVQGDCNGDGYFSITDMMLVKGLLLDQVTFSPAQVQAGDVNGDGEITITDFVQMKGALLALNNLSLHPVSGAQTHNSILLTPGDTCTFAPEAAAAATISESPARTEETVPETTEGTTPETTEETVPETSEPDQAEPPAPAVTVEGDAVTWEAGVVTAVKVGTARLIWQDQTLVVTVCTDPLTISFSGTSLLLDPKQTYQLQPILNHPVNTAITYTSSNEAVVSVDAAGMLTANAEGTAAITAKLPNGKSAAVDVRVLPMIKSITLADDNIKVKNGSSKTIGVTISPATATEKLVWSSSDTSIATVDENGVVTGKQNGTVTITCTSQYGKVSASCQVKVCNLIQVALTFDDGPSSAYTVKVLDMLKQYNVKATFFMVGNRITSKTSPLVKRMADEGHELGYHTMGHTYFFNMNASTIQADFEQFQSIVKAATGGIGATVYRAPGGNITDTALKTIPYPHIMWSVDTRDWEHRNPTMVKQAIINGLKDGAIILLHDIHGTTYTGTLAALKEIIEKDMDVEFLTVTELLSRKGTAPAAGTTYYNGR